nr:MAG TPA: hypothetical protein [Caudoviricetes sp.]
MAKRRGLDFLRYFKNGLKKAENAEITLFLK